MIDPNLLKQFAYQVHADDYVDFSCAQCGDCCRCRDNNPITLTSYDMYQLAKTLKLNSSFELLEHRIVTVSRGCSSGMPICVLNTHEDGSCILLHGNRCSVHSCKPVVCAIFPYARIYDNTTEQYVYFRNYDFCKGCIPSTASNRSFSSWLDQYHITETDPYYTAAATALVECAESFINISRPRLRKKASLKIACALYACLNPQESYLSQLETNMSKIRPFLTKATKSRRCF